MGAICPYSCSEESSGDDIERVYKHLHCLFLLNHFINVLDERLMLSKSFTFVPECLINQP